MGLYAHFVDFEKAFDSVHRESLWNIMRSYGIPDKMVRVTVGIYAGFECAVVDRTVTSDWFRIKSVVKQGCMMSGFLFLLCLDWVMRKATADKRRGIRWNFTTVLEDLDFADDNGLKLNARRTECASSREKIVFNGEEVDDVEAFTYLEAFVDKKGGGRDK